MAEKNQLITLPKWSGRGKGKCPSCREEYANSKKPINCFKCGHFIGGKIGYERPAKKPKLHTIHCTELVDDGKTKLYSVKTSNNDDRCIVVKAGRSYLCHHEKCKQVRGVLVTSPDIDVQQFECEHTSTVSDAQDALEKTNLTPSDLSKYPCDEKTRQKLQACLQNQNYPTLIKVSEKTFAVLGEVSTSTPAMYTHVQKIGQDKIKCLGKGCNNKAGDINTRQQKAKNMCLHIHMLLASMQSSVPKDVNNTDNETSVQNISRKNTISMLLKKGLPHEVPREWLEKCKTVDSISVLRRESEINGDRASWADYIFQPTEEVCLLCKHKLTAARRRKGSKGDQYVITGGSPFTRVRILVKYCINEECQAMHQSNPIDLGLFNVQDKVLVSLETLLELRELLKRGVPLTTAIDSKLATFQITAKTEDRLSDGELRNVSELMYDGFYYFEAISERDLNSSVCGLCGIAAEVILGDGNQKNACSNKGIDYESGEDKEEHKPLSLEEFLQVLKSYFIEKAVYSKAEIFKGYQTSAYAVPPIIAPALRGEKIYNTELSKKSYYLKERREGDQAVLHALIKEKKLSMEEMNTMTLEELRMVAVECKIDVAGISKAMIKSRIHGLYCSLLSGNSPCHGFGKLPGNTGGFYHLVCRHGCTVASKFILLKESVRDAADLYLSLKYQPTLFICDTPCTFVRHTDLRDPESAKSLWGDKSGCFEKPTLGRKPEKQNIPAIVPVEYRSDNVQPKDAKELGKHEHPISQTSEHYVSGDRFHTSAEPHKNELCAYHDLMLCLQEATIKTSYQESENHRKNFLRLRSSTMQEFKHHFFYNFLMDFYHNDQIVKRQKVNLAKGMNGNQEMVRDSYMRFCKRQREDTT